MTRKRKLRKRERLLMRALAEANDRIRDMHPFANAQFDRIYIRPDGTRTILEGNSGHTSAYGFHHGRREGCPVCFDRMILETGVLPLRFAPDEES